MEASFASGEPFEEEMRVHAAPMRRWFLSRAVPLRDKRKGKVVKWYGAATSIQDHKRAEELQSRTCTPTSQHDGELVASISHELA